MTCITRALLDTKNQLLTLLFSAVIGAVSLYFLYLWRGHAAAIAEIPSHITALFGAIVGLLLVFFWNLICAPYRIQKERADSAVAELSELRALNIKEGGDEIPWFLRDILSLRQCRVFAAGDERIQVHYPWRLRCTPSISINNRSNLSMKHEEDFQFTDITDLGLTITLTHSFLKKHSADETVKTLNQTFSMIDAASEEAISMAARVFNFPKIDDWQSSRQVAEFIYENLNDPKKGLPFLVQLAKDQ